MAVSHGTYTIVDVMDGELGVNTATIYLYKRSNGTPTGLPAGNVKYKFSEHRIIEGTLNGWVEDISELSVTGYPIYMIMATASAPSDEDTDIIDTEEWAGPIEIAKDGEPGTPGYNQATIYLYQRTNNPSALVVPTSATYNFHTGVLSNIGNWSREIPNNTGNNGPCYVISAAAIGTGETYSSFVWSSISKLVEDGEDGITITTVLYGISNDSSTEPSRWDTNPPTGVVQGSWLWTKTIYSDNSFVISKSYTGVDGSSIEIESTSIQYQVSNSGTVVPTGEWHDTVQQTTTGEFLWTRTIISYSDGSSTTAYSVAAHGEAGSQGTSVIKTENFYYLKPSGGTAPTPETEGSVEVPDFIDGGTYYKRTVTYLSVGGPIKGNWEIDGALTSENQKALDAFVDAGIAKQRTRKVISNSNEGVTVAAGINGGEITPGTISTYGYNTIMDPNYLGLRYNDINLTKLTTMGLEIYYPTIRNEQPTQGQLGLKLTADTLAFYKPNTTPLETSAILDAKGLVLSRGGIEAGNIAEPSSNYIYIYSEDDEVHHTFNINESGEKYDWRIVAGNSFGVDKTGNLYATNASINGAITATSLTIGSGSSSYDGVSAINASGYSIEIIEDASAAPQTIDTDMQTYLYPILYLNGVAVPASDIVFTNFKWYKDSAEIAYEGDSAHGGHVSEYGHTYRVTYQFDDTAVGEVPIVQEVKITDEKYITEINGRGIRVHPEDTSGNNYIQIADNIEIYRSGISVAEYGTVMRIGDNNSSHFLINSDSLQAFSSTDATNPYFEVNANGLRWGSNIENYAATQSDINNALSTYITVIDNNGIFVSSESQSPTIAAPANSIRIDGNGLEVYKEGISVAKFGDSVRIGKPHYTRIELDNNGMELRQQHGGEIYYIIAHLGFGVCQTESGTETTPYYDFTTRMGEKGAYSLVEGMFTEASGMASHAEGYDTKATGHYSHTEGYDNTASGKCSHAEGYYTEASEHSSHAEGRYTEASGMPSHSEGEYSVASGDDAHAEGSHSTASAWCAHAEGYYSIASNELTHVEGDHSTASGYASHANGVGVVAQGHAQTAIGQWNNPIGHAKKQEVVSTDPIFIIGNGDSEYSKTNALTVDWSGNLKYSGSSSQMSDRRLKDHQSYLSTDATQFIQSLKPAYFKKNEQPHVGFYAQDVEAADPWNCMVGEMNGFKTLGYTEIIAPLVAYCQHLEYRIKQLEEKE